MAVSSTSFTEGHTHSAKPRKRTALSESALRSALIRNGEGVLFFYEELFEIKVLEDGSKDYSLKERNGEKIKLADRINAANAWSKLVFIQPKDGEEIEENQKIIIFTQQLLQAVAQAKSQGKNIDSNAINALIDIIVTVASNTGSSLSQSIQSVSDEKP